MPPLISCIVNISAFGRHVGCACQARRHIPIGSDMRRSAIGNGEDLRDRHVLHPPSLQRTEKEKKLKNENKAMHFMVRLQRVEALLTFSVAYGIIDSCRRWLQANRLLAHSRWLQLSDKSWLGGRAASDLPWIIQISVESVLAFCYIILTDNAEKLQEVAEERE